MDLVRPNFFAGAYLERRAEAREDPQWLAAAQADPATRYLITRGTAQLVSSGAAPRIVFLSADAPLVKAADPAAMTLLGWFAGRRCVLVELAAASAVPVPPDAGFQELRPLTATLPADEAALLAYARALSIWHARHIYCGVCGAATLPVSAGHCLRCSRESCAQDYFPRLDPAIIVLVSDGERALLGRQAGWPARRYSTIAGFVEPGESLEDALTREVFEETGVTIGALRYDSSQPWPFPSSIMLGFYASAAAGAAVRVGAELEDVRWVTREQVRSGEVLAPPTQSISWRLIGGWLDGAKV
ncbi:MAG TPA: NAD(+) diphosphatase [Steroidobacteraceae bacterium]|jgi:NAD+ diphosphatase|nr:NAD(+) diphosphatase [Steroidobacteraceae bacterium]